jgi:hypothetical protein
VWLAAWLVLSLASSAAAQAKASTPAAVPAAATGPAPAQSTRELAEPRWYGWQILATDVSSLAIGLGIGAASKDQGDRRFGDVVGAAWALGSIGSISVHAAHEDPGMALAGLGGRMLLPPLISVIGLGMGCLASDLRDNCASDSARWSFAFGALGASALDIGLFARERRHDQHHWYGWQSLIIDSAALGAGIIAFERSHEVDRDERFANVVAFPYLIGFLISPWVHAFHGRWGVALGSLGMRLLLPGVGAVAGLMGYCAATGGVGGCIPDGALYGLLGGTLITEAIDIGLLAQERVEPADAHATAFTPYITPSADGWKAGLAASF